MNNEKFKIIYDEMFLPVFRYLKSRSGSIEDAEDISTNVFMIVWENIEKIDMDSNYQAWIMQSTKYKLLDYLRKKYSIESKFNSYAFEEDLQEPELNPELDMPKIANKQKNIAKSNLQKMIGTLNIKEQTFLSLKYYNNLNNLEIAKKLEMSVGNVKVFNNRLIKKLKNLWEINQKK